MQTARYRVLPLVMVLLLVFAWTGAASEPQVPIAREDEEQQCQTRSAVEPAAGAWHRVIPGEALVATWAREECLWARPKADARVSEAGTYIRKGALLWNAGPGRYCLRETATRFCVFDKDGDGRFEKSTTMGGAKGVRLTTPYDEVWIPTGQGLGDRRKELVLLEVTVDSLKAVLREGGSSNEVTYPFGSEGEVSNGGIRAKVRRVEGGVEVFLPAANEP